VERLSLHTASKPVLISSCLLGKNVKYNGRNNHINNSFIQMLLKNNLVIPVCPEVDGGLPIPRTPVELIGKKAINQDGIDKTKEFVIGAQIALQKVIDFDIKMAIMKSKSPSCGKDTIYDGSFTKTLTNGNGITVSLLKEYGIRIFDENELDIACDFWNNSLF